MKDPQSRQTEAQGTLSKALDHKERLLEFDRTRCVYTHMGAVLPLCSGHCVGSHLPTASCPWPKAFVAITPRVAVVYCPPQTHLNFTQTS